MVDVKTISKITGVKTRILRYIIERGRAPGVEPHGQGTGNRRMLTVNQAKLVGIAGGLHKSGFHGPAVDGILERCARKLNQKGRLVLELNDVVSVIIDLDRYNEIK